MNRTKKLTLCGIFCAIYVVLLIPGFLPGIMHIAIDVAIATLIITKIACGTKYYILSYVVASLLSLMVIPNLELVLTAICMGWYPIIRFELSKIADKRKSFVIKSVIFFIASSIIYQISVLIFGVDEITKIIPFFWILYVIMFSVIFWILDAWITVFERLIYGRMHSIILKYFGYLH